MDSDNNKENQKKPDPESEKPETNRLEELQKELYRRKGPSILREKRFKFKPKPSEVEGSWKDQPEDESEKPKNLKARAGLFKKILIASAVFFVIALSLSLLVFFLGFNFISSQKVDISVRGLTTIDGGSELVLDVSVANNNRAGLEDVVLTLEYPEGTRNPNNSERPLARQRESLGSIFSGGSASKTFRSILYGERDSTKPIRIVLEYRIEGSEAVFTQEKIYEVGISSTPISLSILAPKEINSNQETEFVVAVSSNSNNVLEDLILRIDYPLGFSLSESSIPSQYEDNIWILGDLEPRTKKEITLRGIISGQENEEKTFSFKVGTVSLNDGRNIGIEFASALESIFIKRPFINLGTKIGQSSSDVFVTKMGSNVGVKINWENNLPVDLNDAVVEVRLNGNTLNKTSVLARQGGFYRSQDNTIIWDKNTTPDFSRVSLGKKGSLDFSFDTLKPSAGSINLFENSAISMEIIMRGVRFFESSPPEAIRSSIAREVKIETDLSMSARAVYSVGPFSNSGPLPPRAEQETTYTVILSVANTFNSTRQTLVTGRIPLYVNWTGRVHPSGAQVMFNPDTRTVSWNIGNVPGATGFTSPHQEVAFQVSLSPSFGQVNSTPVIMSDLQIIGTDTFTSTDVSEKKPNLTTRISTDPIFVNSMEKVSR